MSKKQLCCGEAERLYVIEQCTFAEIASRLKVNEKTIRSWKDEGDWEVKRQQYLKSKQSFHEELYEFARFLMRKIRDDMNADPPIQVDANRLYMLGRIIPQITKVKEYEEIAGKKDGTGDKPLSREELINLVEKEVMKVR
jgi:hypothetical protein